MACAAGPQAGKAAEDLPALGISKIVALGACNDPWVTLELAVARVGHSVGIQLLRAKTRGL